MYGAVDEKGLLLEINEVGDGFDYRSSIEEAMEQTYKDLEELDETIDSIQNLKNEADKIDYMLAAGAGGLAGLMDVFLVGAPDKSPVGEITDEWFANRTKDFAKLVGWDNNKDILLSSAIQYLENTFEVPYDQRLEKGTEDTIFDLGLRQDYFKNVKVKHNMLGLFYSVLYQFQTTPDTEENNQLIIYEKVDEMSELIGQDIPSKLFAAFVNWVKMFIFDLPNSFSDQENGLGIPATLWTWINNLILIKRQLGISNSFFDQTINKLALKIFNQGYKARFQEPPVILVFVNEILVYFLYSTRRMIHYFSTLESENYSFEVMWEGAQPFTHPTVKRMLTIAHGTFCLVNLSNVTVQRSSKRLKIVQPVYFFLRLNLVGVGRFTISLYGEGKRAMSYQQVKKEHALAIREKVIVEDYMDGLKMLAETYDDQELIQFITDFTSTDLYIEVFEKSVELGRKRDVSDEQLLKNKGEIDQYFRGETE